MGLDYAKVILYVTSLLLGYMGVIETRTLTRRSVKIEMDNPCSINQYFTDIMSTQIQHDIPLTGTQTTIMDIARVRLFETIKNKATIELNKLLRAGIYTNEMDDMYVIDPKTMVVNNDNKEEFINNTGDFMVHIDQKLTDLSGHLKYARFNGQLSSQSDKEDFRENIREIGDEINSARCNLHTHYDISTNSELVISSGFVGFDGDYTWELRRVFVVLRDIKRLTTFLVDLYQSTSN